MQLQNSRFGLADHKRNKWMAVIPAGVPYEKIFEPAYWAHVAVKLRPCDEIIVFDDEMTYRAELVVAQAERVWAKVIELNRLALVAEDAPVSADVIEVKWAGPHDKHRVERVHDGKRDVLARGLDKEAAEKEAARYVKEMGARAA